MKDKNRVFWSTVLALVTAVTLLTYSSAQSTGADDDTHTHEDGLDLELFFEGALEEATIEDCTLSDGTETTCYAITIAGYPANHDVGPFCPETTAATAEEAGIWFDGDAVYDVDGNFILGLADLYNDGNWKLYDDDGAVNITDTKEKFELAARPDVDPSLYNHCVAGQIAWLDDGEPVQTTVTIPVNPVAAESTSAGGNWGVTLNGVIIAASAPVDAILSAYTIAVFDDCGGHINPTDGYHLHGARGCSEVGEAEDGETPIFAYAMDGYPVHSPLSEENAADLDECNGHETEELGYHYHANPAEENSVLTCFTGLTVGGGGRGGQGGPPEGGQPGGVPDFAAAAETLGIGEQDLMDALGGPPPDLEAAAETLGIGVEEIQAAFGVSEGAAGGEAAAATGGTESASSVIDLDAFDSAGLVQAPEVVDCTLTDGAEAQCAQIIVKYLPDDFETGPYCPETLSDVGGIWDWDGDNPGLYRLDEAFWTMLAEQGYVFFDDEGNISVADPGAGGGGSGGNSCLEASEDDTVEATILIPLTPVMADSPTDLGTVAQVGVALGGIPIFADAPSVLDTGNLPALDLCGGHVDPGGWYHWHATATDIETSFEHEGVEADCHLEQSATELFGYAFDGYPIYGSADADGSVPADLDECNGHSAATADYPEGVYHYHASLEFPNLPTCLVGTSADGAFSTNASGGIGAPGGGPRGGGPGN